MRSRATIARSAPGGRCRRTGRACTRCRSASARSSTARSTSARSRSRATAAAFTREEEDLLEYLAGQAVVSIENASLHEAVERQAVTDELTGLANVRAFMSVLDREIERRRRFDHPLGLVMIDLDDFKRVNDTYGHQQGDEVLAHVAWVLRDASRDLDTVARYGGEELAVVLPQTDASGAAQLAERMRRRSRASTFRGWAGAARSRSPRASEWPRCRRTAPTGTS